MTPRFAFFGTPSFAVEVAEALRARGFSPSLAVTRPDAREGRGLKLAPPPMKVWAQEHGIPVAQPEKLDEAFVASLESGKFDVGVVAAYGKILPKRLLEAPRRGMLNVHPSLLPEYRGASPVESALLDGKETTGVSVMLLDEEMDHGPVLAQKEFHISPAMRASELERALAAEGGALLADILHEWVEGNIEAKPQDHTRATYTKKIAKEDGEIDPEGDPFLNARKYRAFEGWPRTYFFKGDKRVIVTEADVSDGFRILKVLPESGREMRYEDFLRGA